MAQLRAFIKAGDIPKAKMVAQQLAQYRNISDKNYARSIYIQTETQVDLKTFNLIDSTIQSQN